MFITLTYDEEHLPSPATLSHRDFQLFMKKLRQHVENIDSTSKEKPTKCTPLCTGDITKNREINFPEKQKAKPTLSYYMSGEYGEKNLRPHFHACVFGFNFQDRQYHQKTKIGETIYTSKTLTKIWGKGYASIGAVTFASAAYIARYIVAKITGPNAKAHYTTFDEKTGTFFERKPEYNKMSLHPALGKRWLEKYQDDVYPHGYIVINGHKVQAPRYYDELYKTAHPKEFKKLQETRQQEANLQKAETTPKRLADRETVQQAQAGQLKRKL